MKNQVIVKATAGTIGYRPAAPSRKLSTVEAGTIGVLTGLELCNSEKIAWVIWDSSECTTPEPVIAHYVEVVGIRIAKLSIITQ
jgi:hypothetical protein